ncbi:MAG: glutamine--fructose-6-phosphate transaminase (isomerizing) [Defluviitaleaceae bacterium]|nr:glutamine--fructose-6-phosphate transaminase (isomerizing) [Defluviitaleaceae bacterium]
MCGIVGFIGHVDAKEILLTGLERLEYRGYDSAGIALFDQDAVHVFKDKGRIANLRSVVDPQVKGTVGMGHTRWATHGKPTQRNAHPHQSSTGRFTLVHNGVIENEIELRETYLSDYAFQSDTDTEVIVALIEKLALTHDLATAIQCLIEKLHGSYALGIIDHEQPDVLYAVKNKSPLLLGKGETFQMMGSDAMAMLHCTDQLIEIHDKEYVRIEKERLTIYDATGQVVNRTPFVAQIDATEIEKGTYAHYMLKEIDEQPVVMRRLIDTYFKAGQIDIDDAILATVEQAKRMYIIAAGTSMHAGWIGKQLLEGTGTPTEVHIASEFVYNTPIITEGALFIFLSQSGETADSRAVLVKMKALGYPCLTLTNVAGSTLSREADHTLLLHAGPEIAVASTKAYTATVAVLAILATRLAGESDFNLAHELAVVATVMESLIADKEMYSQLARTYLTAHHAFYIGRHVDYYTALEAALKLKEISYIQAEGFAAGELKHGTIALIEDQTPVIGIISQAAVHLNTRSNLKEVEARGAKTLTISFKSLSLASDQVIIDDVHPLLAPLITCIPTQLLAYYGALHRQLDIDKPRNLAKSVTVE